MIEIIGGLITLIVGSCFSILICLVPLFIIFVVLSTALGAINGSLGGKR